MNKMDFIEDMDIFKICYELHEGTDDIFQLNKYVKDSGCIVL